MPATEQTWRDQRWLHAIFAVTGVLMLAATVWMFFADHNREWKDTQRTFIKIETRVAAWRDQAMAAKIEDAHALLMSRLLAVRARPVSVDLVNAFQEEVYEDFRTRGYAVLPEEAGEGKPLFSSEPEAESFSRMNEFSKVSAQRGARAMALRDLADRIQELLTEQERSEQAQQAQEAVSGAAAPDPSVSVRDLTSISQEAFNLSREASSLQQQAEEGSDDNFFQSQDVAVLKTVAASLQAAGEAAAKAETQAAEAAKSDASAAVDTGGKIQNARVEASEKLAAAYNEINAAAIGAETAAAESRDEVLGEMRAVLTRARFREDSLLRDRKFKAAEYDEARANRDILVRDTRTDAIPQAEAKIEAIKNDLDALTVAYQDASQHRRDLQETVQQITADEDAIRKGMDENRGDLERLRESIAQQQSTYFVDAFPFLGKRWLELPILDAFNSPRKIDNLWTDGLTIQYGSFSKVRRFDRCTTCHQAIGKTAPGSAVDAAYPHEVEVELVLSTPEKSPLPLETNEQGQPQSLSLEAVYGFDLAEQGVIDRDDVTVAFVRNESRAARAVLVANLGTGQTQAGQDLLENLLHTEGWNDAQADAQQPGLRIGDVITQIGNNVVRDRDEAMRLLLQTVKWGEAIRIKVRRGMPHPYASHPRLDLFVGSLSPHPMNVFGCTVCHEGQGSATAFKWASHTPNTPREAEEWREKYGWFSNHHWIFPMQPERFAESTCLKCHHDVTELEPSEKYPDPPAPKVVQGHDLIAKYGCFGCHEINGFDGPNRRIGPDLRLEPNYYAAAQQLISFVNERREGSGGAAEVPPAVQEATGEGGVLQGVDLSNAADLQQRAQALQQELDAWSAIGEADQDDGTKARLAAIRAVLPHLASMGEAGSQTGALDEVAQLAEQLVAHPELDQVRHKLHRILLEDIERAQGQASKAASANKSADAEAAQAQSEPLLPPQAHKLEPVFKDIEVPGQLRKAGPALRYVASKDDEAFLLDWIRQPSHFRPDTRMPQFFGLRKHLESHGGGHDADSDATNEEHDKNEGRTALKTAEVFEPVEILGMTLYLLDRSQKFEFLEPPSDVAEWTEQEQTSRGKILFETRGCLACHNHEAFPDAAVYRYDGDIVQGPDLSGLASKFDPQRNPVGRQWLYSWIKEPTRYHPRTLMPDLFLDPYADAEGRVIDPAADIVAFLMSYNREDWKPAFEDGFALNESGNLPEGSPARDALRDLSLQYLATAFYEKAAERYYESGVPEALRDELKGAEVELIADNLNDRQRLIYVGSKAISKYGCYGCHDIPGFEDAKPIGTGLADWGRKDTSRLAFEHITHYIHEGHRTHGPNEPHIGQAEGPNEPLPPYYEEALEAGHREGFIFQKLREPRSYDYEKADNKGYNEWLRMPQFPFNNKEREQVITFVLGLVAEPPAPQFIYQPSQRDRALQEGRRVLAKYNCGGCHTLEMEKWELSFPPGEFRAPPASETFEFVHPDITPEALTASKQTDHRGMLHATIVGQPFVDNNGIPTAFDEFGDPVELDGDYDPAKLEYLFQLFKPAVIDGNVHMVGPAPFSVKAPRVEKQYPAHGGYLARYLVPRVIHLEREVNPAAKASEAWGWVPPPLVGQGQKVQPEWLYNFLLNPYPIRPAAFLRMPKFNMSGAEAQALVDYFAAKDNAAYPYDLLARRQPGVLEDRDQQYQEQNPDASRLDDAMKIVTNNAGCVKCHLVGDFEPQGSPRAKAPDLADVYRRLRADYIRPWIAKPDSILPYTGMPVNIHPQTGFATQGLYHGSPLEQLDGLVDLLMNYDTFAQRKNSIADLVQAANPPLTDEEGVPPATGETTESATGDAASSVDSSEPPKVDPSTKEDPAPKDEPDAKEEPTEKEPTE